MMAADRQKVKRTSGILVVAFLMILFGLAEIATGISGSFLGVISARPTLAYTVASVAIGSFYAAAGLLILTMRKWAAGGAICLLIADIAGRFTLIAIGLFPFIGLDAFSIVAGTAIAAGFAIYIGWHWEKFG